MAMQKLIYKPFGLLARRIPPLRASMCTGATWEGGIDEDDDMDDASKIKIRDINYKLKGFIMLHRYREALEVWKEYRADINNTPHSSTTYELLLNAFQTPQTVEALRQDMLRLGVVMNDGCGLAYVRLLLKNDKTSEVMDFVKTDLVLRGSPWFISRVMDFLMEEGLSQLSLEIGKLYLPTQVIEGEEEEVIASRVRALGSLHQLDKARELVHETYGDTTNIPNTVKLSLVDALSLSDDPKEAFKELNSVSSYGVQTVAYLVESIQRTSDTGKLAVTVFDHCWSNVQAHLNDCKDIGITTSIKNNYLLKMLNAMLNLQIIGLQEITQSQEDFYSHNFFTEMRRSHIQPNMNTYKALLDYCCYDDRALKWLDNTIKRLTKNKTVPSPDAMICWCKENRCLDPCTVIKMVSIVRLHCHLTGQQLTMEHFERILTVNNRSLEVKTIKILQKMMEGFGLIHSNISACNFILKAYNNTGLLGPVFMFYQDIHEIYRADPDIHTFHILVDSVLQDGSHRSCYAVIYKTWRLLLASKIQPDIEIVNKLVKCCRVAKDYERAFYFFSIMDSYNLIPDKESLLEMLRVCNEMNDQEMLQGVKSLADTLYPENKLFIDEMNY